MKTPEKIGIIIIGVLIFGFFSLVESEVRTHEIAYKILLEIIQRDTVFPQKPEMEKPIDFCQNLSNSTTSNREIRHLISPIGQQTKEPFYTTSKNYIDSGFPANPTFTKKYDDSYVWIYLFLDYTNNQNGRTDFIQLHVINENGDIVSGRNFADDVAKANNLMAGGFWHITNMPTGEYIIKINVAVTGGQGKFLTDLALINAFEVPVEC